MRIEPAILLLPARLRLAPPVHVVRTVRGAAPLENDLARARLMADAGRYFSSDVHKGRLIDIRV